MADVLQNISIQRGHLQVIHISKFDKKKDNELLGGLCIYIYI